jgi:fatty acid desaturase
MVTNVTTVDHFESSIRTAPSVNRERLRILMRKSSGRGAVKVGIYLGSIACLSLVYVSSSSVLAHCFVVVAMGFVFAHGLELQHEALHQNLFKRPILNRIFGVLLGIPMLVSYTHYKSYHFHHHVAVGSDDDEEIVEYSLRSLRAPVRLMLRAWNVTRVPRFLGVLLGMFRGQFPARVKKAEHGRLFWEYVLITAILSLAACGSVIWGTEAIVVLWLAPWLLVAEPMHFLIELPEHLGCNRKTASILHNTRSYRTSFFWGYLSNYNNYHIEHHLWPGVPSHRLRHLHRDVVEAKGHCSAGFWQALAEVRQATRSDATG